MYKKRLFILCIEPYSFLYTWRPVAMAEKALIIVDMLNDFINENGRLYCGETARKIVHPINVRLGKYRKNRFPVIFLQDSHNENDLEFDRFPPHCVQDTWGSEIIPELTPQRGETVIPKTRFSGFFKTDLERILAETGASEITVVGVCTSICVMDTVGGLADRDYRISVPAGEVADFNPEFHDFALKRMESTYGAKLI